MKVDLSALDTNPMLCLRTQTSQPIFDTLLQQSKSPTKNKPLKFETGQGTPPKHRNLMSSKPLEVLCSRSVPTPSRRDKHLTFTSLFKSIHLVELCDPPRPIRWTYRAPCKDFTRFQMSNTLHAMCINLLGPLSIEHMRLGVSCVVPRSGWEILTAHPWRTVGSSWGPACTDTAP